MRKFKKIYLEITNICNLKCSFCSVDNRKLESISLSKMEELLNRINNYTDYVYLHVKGEPLLHPELGKILDLCKKYDKWVNITTNGTLLKNNCELLKHPIIRQINVSLHSENSKDKYLEEIFNTVDELSEKHIVYRFWTMNNDNLGSKALEIVDKLVSYYELSPEIVDNIKKDDNIRICNNIFISKANQFVWPDLKNDYYEEKGYCYALRDQIAILVDGTVVACCLDSKGVTSFGNIYEQDLDTIINSKKFVEMRKGFCNRKVTEELCKHCSFKNELIKNKKIIDRV